MGNLRGGLDRCAESHRVAAERLHVSRQTFHDILAGKQAVTAGMALRLGRLFGNSAEFWLRLQQTYDLKRAELELAAELATIEPLAAA